LRLQLFGSVGTRVIFKSKYVSTYLLSNVWVEFTKVPFGGGRQVNAISQDSVSQLLHEITEWSGSFPFRLFERGSGVVDI